MSILKEFEQDFYPAIRERGKKIQEEKKVYNVKKIDDMYTSEVLGSNLEIYNVEIDPYYHDLYCSCPCEGECKHIYATLLEIEKGNYKNINLLDEVEITKVNIADVINDIPSDEIKNYLLSISDILTEDQKEVFENKFINFYPKKSYDYYYTNIYNNILLENNNIYTTIIDDIKKYVESKDYEQVFTIISSFINVTLNLDYLYNDKKIIDYLNSLGVYLRITYRYANTEFKEVIELFADEILKVCNIYIEDFIINNIIIYKK